MSTWFFLFKDPLFLAALLVFAVGLVVLLWGVAALRQMPGSLRRPFAAPAAPRKPVPLVPDAIPTATSPPYVPAPASRADDALVAVVEERLVDILRRVQALENARAAGGDKAAPALDPLIARIKEVESEVEKLKLFVVDVPPPAPAQSSQDLIALARRVDGLQKLLESLALETEVAKPS